MPKNKERKDLKIANYVGGVTPKEFSPPPFRYFPHFRIPSIKEAEMKHFKQFIESTGGKWNLSKNRSSMQIASLENSASDMGHVTEKGFFINRNGDAFMQRGGKFNEAGRYNPKIHGIVIPMAEKRDDSRINNLKIGTA